MTTELSATITGGPYAAAAARRALGGLRALVGHRRLADISLLVSELITNGVRHGGAGKRDVLELTVLRDRSRLRVIVTDRGPGFAGRACSRVEEDQTGGWGLFLVERLADRWGAERRGRTTAVWFDLGFEVPPSGAAACAASRPRGRAMAVS
ncbi:MAG TPA: ATP-binding protein [Solirubrobacteraceae bacterium]|nr:ATP-binding protein [Solirubrobacteraceae bacterium]